MRFIITLVLVLFIGCKSKYSNQENNICDKANTTIKDTVFTTTDIITSFKYNDSCHIDRINFIIQLDERSGKIPRKNELRNIVFDIAYIDKYYKHNVFFSQKNVKIFDYDDSSNIITGIIEIDKPKTDTINYIIANTIIKDYTKRKTYFTEPYTYAKSLSLVNMDNTYLDYKAFRKTNVVFKNISKLKTRIDSIFVTIKTNKNVDCLTKFNLKINDTLSCNFKNSIKVDYNNLKVKSNKVVMYSLVKRGGKYISFKLDLTELALYEIYSITANVY